MALLIRRWWWPTLLVLGACGVMIRLGIWQLDRLDQRRQFNARVQAQLDRPVLTLSRESLDENLEEMEYRSVVVVGTYRFEDEVALRNQARGNQPGVHLVTPLVIEGSDEAVLVDRGWIPAEDSAPERWAAYRQPGVVEVEGVIRRSTTRPDIGRRSDPLSAPGEGPLKVWNLLNVERIAGQTPVSLLPVYIQQSAGTDQEGLPFPQEIELDLSEGPHLGYAGQWFMFASILALGFPFYVRRQEISRAAEKSRELKDEGNILSNATSDPILMLPQSPQHREKMVHD